MNGFYLKKQKVNLKEDENEILLAIADVCVKNEIIFEYKQVNVKFDNYKTRLYKIIESDILFVDYTNSEYNYDFEIGIAYGSKKSVIIITDDKNKISPQLRSGYIIDISVLQDYKKFYFKLDMAVKAIKNYVNRPDFNILAEIDNRSIDNVNGSIRVQNIEHVIGDSIGIKRAVKLEEWVYGILFNGYGNFLTSSNDRDSEFDFTVSDIVNLGSIQLKNPVVPFEVKGYSPDRSISKKDLKIFAGKLSLHNFQAGVFITTAYKTESTIEYTRNIYKEKGILIVVLDGINLKEISNIQTFFNQLAYFADYTSNI